MFYTDFTISNCILPYVNVNSACRYQTFSPGVEGYLFCSGVAVVKFISRTDETQTVQTVSGWSHTCYSTPGLKSRNLPESEGQTVTSHLRRGKLAHPASPRLTRSIQTLLLLGDKQRTKPHRPRRHPKPAGACGVREQQQAWEELCSLPGIRAEL